MSRCVSWERLVDYWASDLDPAEVDGVDEHLFACEACSEVSARVARIARAFRSAPWPIVTAEQVNEARARGAVIEESAFAPGERRLVVFPPTTDILVHHLGGLDLTTAERVDVLVKSESSGEMVHEDLFAPFDRARGEVRVACQRHFAAHPRDIVFEVWVHRPVAPPSSVTYFVPHEFQV